MNGRVKTTSLYFDEQVHFPDYRIEYEVDGREQHQDVELFTEHYRGAHAASHSQTGFRIYVVGSRGGRGRSGRIRAVWRSSCDERACASNASARSTSLNQSVVRRCAKRHHQMIVGQVVCAAFGCRNSNELSLEINGVDCGFDEAGSSKCSTDGLRAVPQLQPARAGLEKERREHEEVLAADESDLDMRAARQDASRCRTAVTPPNPPPRTTMRMLSSEQPDHFGERSSRSTLLRLSSLSDRMSLARSSVVSSSDSH